MDDFISREAARLAMTALRQEDIDFFGTVIPECFPDASAIEAINKIPAADVVSRDCYDRILAENDTMREMLAQIGKKPGDKMDDVRSVRSVAEISDAVDEVLDFLNENSNCMPYHIYSALFDLVSGICPNCGADMKETGR